ncbi:MAG: hypothetical protein GY696_39790 [Gammaproteobacteria bacterium]|nr:hypothetical protein [Gammaproteobacteria bacterium]
MTEQQITKFFDREEGDPLGLLTDEKMMVTRVQAGTMADGQIQLGDIMQKVNGYQIRDKVWFKHLQGYCQNIVLKKN